MYSKEEYEKALKIVAEYEQHEEADFEIRKVLLYEALSKYFKRKRVSGRTVKKFDLFTPNYFSQHQLVIDSKIFDEDYEDDKADAEIAAIGKEFGIDVGWYYAVYPK